MPTSVSFFLCACVDFGGSQRRGHRQVRCGVHRDCESEGHTLLRMWSIFFTCHSRFFCVAPVIDCFLVSPTIFLCHSWVHIYRCEKVFCEGCTTLRVRLTFSVPLTNFRTVPEIDCISCLSWFFCVAQEFIIIDLSKFSAKDMDEIGFLRAAHEFSVSLMSLYLSMLGVSEFCIGVLIFVWLPALVIWSACPWFLCWIPYLFLLRMIVEKNISVCARTGASRTWTHGSFPFNHVLFTSLSS